MNGLYEEFKGRGFTLLLINMGEDPDLVRRTVRARGYTAPVLLDPDQKVTADYLVTGSPTVYVVDRRFQVINAPPFSLFDVNGAEVRLGDHKGIRRAIGRRDWTGGACRRLVTAP